MPRLGDSRMPVGFGPGIQKYDASLGMLHKSYGPVRTLAGRFYPQTEQLAHLFDRQFFVTTDAEVVLQDFASGEIVLLRLGSVLLTGKYSRKATAELILRHDGIRQMPEC